MPKLVKKLYRSKKDSMIAGVCGGIAEYLRLDATLIRLLWLLFTFIGGSGILVYLIAWAIIPQAPDESFIIVEEEKASVE